MNNTVIFEVTARAEVVLKKLAKAQIPVGNLKIHGAKVRFGVNDENIKKVFAIFKHPCYNTVIRRKSVKMRFTDFCKRRLGIIVGLLAFIVLCSVPQTLVLKVSVTGNAPHLTGQIEAIAEECGVQKLTPCSRLDKPLLLSKVSALNGVEFCSVTRSGWALIIDVHTSNTPNVGEAKKSPLRAEKSGVLKNLVCICGTAEKTIGVNIAAGDVLIGNYEVLQDGTQSECLAAGYAEIEVEGSVSLFYQTQNAQNEKAALSAPSLYSDRVTKKSLSITPCDGGFYYKVNFTYLYTQAWNMD